MRPDTIRGRAWRSPDPRSGCSSLSVAECRRRAGGDRSGGRGHRTPRPPDHSRSGRFLSVLPPSRAEDSQIREWAQTHPFDWTEAAKRPGKGNGDPDQVYWTAPAPIPTSQGHRITWVRSSQKLTCDAEARSARIEQGIQALEGVQARLASPRSRLKTRVAA
jgi:hypothetical protein